MLGSMLNRVIGTSQRGRTTTGVFDNAEYNEYARTNETSNPKQKKTQISSRTKRDEQVWAALSNLEQDMQLLDNLAGQRPQLTALELLLLSASVTAASSSPWIMGGRLTEVLPPTAAACK